MAASLADAKPDEIAAVEGKKANEKPDTKMAEADKPEEKKDDKLDQKQME